MNMIYLGIILLFLIVYVVGVVGIIEYSCKGVIDK